MTLEQPWWLLLIPVLIGLSLFLKRLRLLLPLRLAAIMLISLLLANPKISRQEKALDLWVLLDRSLSTENLIDKNFADWNNILEKSKPSARDQVRIINYGAEVIAQGTGETAIYSGGRQLTRTALALQTAMALSDEARPSRVLLFSDGYSTEPLGDLAEKLNAQAIPLDFRLVRDEVADDYRISRLQVPSRTLIGEPFVISITCRGHDDGPLPIEIFRDDQSLLKSEVTLTNGVGKIDLSDRLGKPGSYKYSARISPQEDAHPGNNTLDQWAEITGGPRLLLLTGYTNDPLAVALRRQGFSVEMVTDTKSLHLGQLAGTRACIFNNVPAHQVPRDFQQALDFFVRDQGGGLVMIGGESSFGSGGYHESPVDALLPVTMELKSEHRKVSTALAIVMDRSGSMSAQVGATTKMALANNGAINAINLLGNNDYIMVSAVDSEAHTFVPLTRIQGKREDIIDRVRRIQSMGGGIYVYNGLEDAWKRLQKAPSKTRHIILFSDASDSEEPGAYKKLVEEMVANDVSISVIGLGTDKDPDAALLADIATRGNGRIFFTENAADVPVIFSQETVTIARSAFLKDPVATRATGQWSEISPKEPKWLPQIDGYNLSYLRPKASVDLVSSDEYLAPLVSHMRVGTGRSMAVSFPLGGDYSQQALAWPGYGDFVQTMSRWLMGLDLPAGIALKQKLEGTALTVDLLYDPAEWGDELAERPPVIRLNEDQASSGYEVMWKRIAPGHFTLTHDLAEGAVVRGSAVVGDFSIPFGPLTVGNGAEWAFDAERVKELRHLASVTGGRELLDLTRAWLRPEQIRIADLRVWLAGLILLVFLLDALITRAGWPLWTSVTEETGPSPAKKTKVKKAKDEGPKPPRATTPPASTEARQSRFDRAKRRR